MQTLTPQWTSYELLDSGGAAKLEQFGEFRLIRPEPQAKWARKMPKQRWDGADAEFVKRRKGESGEWKFRGAIPPRWEMERNGLRFWVQPAPSGHVGVFPDQASHWDWLAEICKRAGTPVRMLSLFAHTGVATLAACVGGAEVTHVDASRKAVALARDNQNLSGLDKRPVRWVVEDALTFVLREARRGNKYDALMIDPPRFGRGPDGEIWKLEESLPKLLRECGKVLSASPAFVLLNVYTTVLTRERIENEARRLSSCLKDMLSASRAMITSGETGFADLAGRRISGAVFARAVF